jgi:hypothetical protein
MYVLEKVGKGLGPKLGGYIAGNALRDELNRRVDAAQRFEYFRRVRVCQLL